MYQTIGAGRRAAPRKQIGSYGETLARPFQPYTMSATRIVRDYARPERRLLFDCQMDKTHVDIVPKSDDEGRIHDCGKERRALKAVEVHQNQLGVRSQMVSKGVLLASV